MRILPTVRTSAFCLFLIRNSDDSSRRWGTTYSSNLRLSMQNFSEEQWIKISRSVELRPPMPWFVLRVMTEQDLRAIYRFIRHLGPAGEPAPSYLPPDQEPPNPYLLFP